MKRVLVTGAAGFIGSHLVRYLKDRGYWVRAVDYQPPKYGNTVADEHDWQCDLRYGWNASRAMVDIDHVYALAAYMGGAGFVFVEENDLDILTYNTRINLSTLAAAAAAGVERYLFSSSACIYPEHLQVRPDCLPLKEEDAYPADPDSEYGWEKLYAERLCQNYGKITDMKISIARFHNIYGPQGSWNDGREKAPAALCRKVAEAKMRRKNITQVSATISPKALAILDGMGSGPSLLPVEIWGDGKATRSFCYIDDCLEMLHRLMLSDYSEPLNVGTDRSISIDDLAHLIAEIASIKIDLVHVPGPQGVRGRNADLSKMEKVLCYRPKVSLEDGMAHLYGWIEAQVSEES